jgi:hypothetical protein
MQSSRSFFENFYILPSVFELNIVKNKLISTLLKGTKGNWTKAELNKIRPPFVALGKKVPILMVSMLVLWPVFIEVSDRRKKKFSVQESRRRPKKNV